MDGGLGLKGWGSTLLLLQTAVALVTTPVWSKLGARIERRTLLALNYGWQLATAPLVLLLPMGMLAPAIGFLVLRSVLAGVDFLVLRTMAADLVRDSAAAGLQCGASCHSVCNITMRLAMGAGVWLVLSLLSAISVDGSALATSLARGDGLIVRAAYALPSMLAGGVGLLVLAQGRTSKIDATVRFAPTAAS